MSLFTDGIARTAAGVSAGLLFGDPECLQTTSWSEIATSGRAVTAVLRDAGVSVGDRVAALMACANDVAPVVQGVWGAGAALTMLHQPTRQADLGAWPTATLDALEMLRAQVVLVGEPFLHLAPLLRQGGYQVVEIPSQWSASDTEPFSPPEDAVALYQLTSGSTGVPKAVAITHANLHACVSAMRQGAGVDVDADVMVSWLPLSHDMGMVGFLLAPMFVGMKTIYVAPTEFVKSPMIWIRLISDHAGTMTAAPNSAYSIVHQRMKAIDDRAFDLSHLRFALCGAEPISPATMTEFVCQATRFGMKRQAVVAAYGLAEATLAVSFARLGQGLRVERLDANTFELHRRAVPADPDDATGKEVVISGPPLPGFTTKIIDSSGVDLPARHLGEILVHSAAVTKCYATAEGDVEACDGDGWLHTGDLGYLTETGEIVVCGRLKNVIIVAGRNICPSEIEAMAETADGVRAGAVVAFGVTTPDGSEEITVVAETLDDHDEQLHRQVRRQIMRNVFGAIGLNPNVVLVDRGSIQKTACGKIRHLETKKKFAKSLAPDKLASSHGQQG